MRHPFLSIIPRDQVRRRRTAVIDLIKSIRVPGRHPTAMGSLTKCFLQVLFLGAVALAIPLSLIEDVKELRLKSPARSNKVKRAQEVIMFGNQQNRGNENRGPNLQRTEKRAASDIDDNTLTDVATLPNILPQMDENKYESNQLEVGSRVADLDRAYQYGGGEPVYNMQLRNAYKDQLYNDPMFSELGMYNMVDARRKREAKLLQNNYKLGFRSKRELDFNPDDILPLIKLWEAEQRNKLRDSRIGYPPYGIDTDDYDGESQEENEIEPDSEYMQNGHWLDGPVMQHRPMGNSEFALPRQHKRFMVSKRRMGEDGYSQLKGTKQDMLGHGPVYRRFIL